ncbi:hypothetical protein CTI12_AA310200 [Artemisia annua]|uniref:Polymerase nucleotidyl transferase domain-containing protein n=1 Tax=Artemisia annua TaxID=35608 RepID=A0A2U1N448_ARTAN|nr:hypothetical protein CTI12_AA310200 [Artemisia annua]
MDIIDHHRDHDMEEENDDSDIMLSVMIPTQDEDDERTALIAKIKTVIEDRFGNTIKVFPYGSTPLKTYMPDGDIDFTILGGNSNFNLTHLKDFFTHGCEAVAIRVVNHIMPAYAFGANLVLGKRNLLKKSIMLTKCWAKNEDEEYKRMELIAPIKTVIEDRFGNNIKVLHKFTYFAWESKFVTIEDDEDPNGKRAIYDSTRASSHASMSSTHGDVGRRFRPHGYYTGVSHARAQPQSQLQAEALPFLPFFSSSTTTTTTSSCRLATAHGIKPGEL